MSALVFRRRVQILVVVSVIAITVMFLVPRVAQPTEYHDFADQRIFLGIPHTCNVVSNAPFVLVGVCGMCWLMCGRNVSLAFVEPRERCPYFIFFLLIALTGVGSAYYHADPNNGTLVWDRLPLAMAFMALFAIIIAERVSRPAGMWLLPILIAVGAGSVVYWHWSESNGQGDLRVYLLVQFYPLLALPLILFLFRSRYSGTADLVAALALYILAKILELLDKIIYAQGQIVSGHTLKHLVAALSACMVLFMLQRRRPLNLPAMVSQADAR